MKLQLRQQVCIPQMVAHSEAHGLGSCQLSNSFLMEYARGGLSPSRDKAEERLSTPVLVHFSQRHTVDGCEILHQLIGGLSHYLYQWIGLRENLQETIVFTIKYGGFL